MQADKQKLYFNLYYNCTVLVVRRAAARAQRDEAEARYCGPQAPPRALPEVAVTRRGGEDDRNEGVRPAKRGCTVSVRFSSSGRYGVVAVS